MAMTSAEQAAADATLLAAAQAAETALHANCPHTSRAADATPGAPTVQVAEQRGDTVQVTVCLDPTAHCLVGCGLDRVYSAPSDAPDVLAAIGPTVQADAQRDVAPAPLANLVGGTF